MLFEGFLVTLKERQEKEKYGKIEVYASSKNVARHYPHNDSILNNLFDHNYICCSCCMCIFGQN
jgi:hypothetical protein